MHPKIILIIAFVNFVFIDAIAQKGKFKILTYNIRNAKGLDGKTDYNRITTILKDSDADIIGLQELDSVTKRSAGIDVLKVLASNLKMHAAYGGAISFQNGKYGVGILSKQKPLQHYTIPLPGREEQRVLLVAEFKQFVVFNTHLSLTKEDRIASIDIIHKEAKKFTKPVYLLGDLNAEPASPEIIFLKENWKLLSVLSHTFPANQPDRCIDYIFLINGNKRIKKSIIVNEPVASDHRPVMAVLK
jgi:endonuclease/exonuclease/phosphatase family metal-dependent hydrolase